MRDGSSPEKQGSDMFKLNSDTGDSDTRELKVDAAELSERQLESVAGGTKTVDAASPNLSAFCCNGKHIPAATLTLR